MHCYENLSPSAWSVDNILGRSTAAATKPMHLPREKNCNTNVTI